MRRRLHVRVRVHVGRVAVLSQLLLDELLRRERRVHATLVEEGHDRVHRLRQHKRRIRRRSDGTHTNAAQALLRILLLIPVIETHTHADRPSPSTASS